MTTKCDFQTRIAPFRQRSAALGKLAKIYRRYPTAVSDERKAVLRQLTKETAKTGRPLALFVGGSLAYSQAVDQSDVDIPLMVWKTDQEPFDQFFERTASYPPWLHNVFSDLEINSVELRAVEGCLRATHQPNLNYCGWDSVKLFYYYYWLCPLHLGFDCASFIKKLERAEQGQQAILNYLDSVLEALRSREDFWSKSFQKYRQRLDKHPIFQTQTGAKRRAIFNAISRHEQTFFYSFPC